MKTIRIFLSSTFRDMDVERDALRNIVAPRLNKELAVYNMCVDMVDLRHTVETNPKLSQNEREQCIFNICLDEIESCSPYFIALIGHRYGWIPDVNKMGVHQTTGKMLRDDFPLNENEISVTSYEFLKGLFIRGQKNSHCLVYVRNSLSYEELSLSEKELYVDSDKDDKRRNSVLRDYIIKNFIPKGEKGTYILNPTGNNKVQLNDWCNSVYTDIFHLLSDEITKAKKSTPQQAAYQFFVQAHIRNFMGREDEISKCVDQIKKYGVCNIISTTDGVGRSSLLCKLYEKLSSEKKLHCIFVSNQAVVNITPKQELRYVCGQMALELEIPDAQQKSIFEEENEFFILHKLKELAYERKMTFYIFWDNYNEELERLNWETMGDMRPIITTTKISTKRYKIIQEQGFLHYIFIEEFKDHDVKNILYGKRRSFVETIFKKNKPRNPQWLSLAINIYNNLNKADYFRIRSASNSDQEKNIDTYITNMVQEMPDDVSELSYFWLKKLYAIFGEDFCDNYLGALSLIETGLTDKDVSSIIKQPEDWCIYFRQMAGSQIIENTDNGTWRLTTESRLTLLTSLPTSRFEEIATNACKYAQYTSLPYLSRANLFILSLLGKDHSYCQEYLKTIGNAENDWFRDITLSDLADKDIAQWFEAKSLYITKLIKQLITETNLSYDFVLGINCLMSLATLNGHQKEYLIITSLILEELRKNEIIGKVEEEHYLIKAYLYSKRAGIYIGIKDFQESDNQSELGLLLCKHHIVNTKNWRNTYYDLIKRKIDSVNTPNKKMAYIKEYFIPISLEKSIAPSIEDVESVISFCNLSSFSSILYQDEGKTMIALELLQKAIKLCKSSIVYADDDISFTSLWQVIQLKDVHLDLAWYLCKIHLETKCCNRKTLLEEIEFALKNTEEYIFKVKEEPTMHVKNYAIRCMYVLLLSKSSKDKAIKEIFNGMLPLIIINDPYSNVPADENAMYDISVAWMLCARLFLMLLFNEDKVDDVPGDGLFDEVLCPIDIVNICNNILKKHILQNTDELMLDIRYVYIYVLYIFLKIEEKKEFIHIEACSICLDEYLLYSQECRMLNMRFMQIEEDMQKIGAKLNASLENGSKADSIVANSYNDLDDIIAKALDNDDIITAERESDRLLEQILTEDEPDSMSLGNAFFLSGLVQLKKKIWFKAYDRLEKSIKAYEQDGNSIAPIFVYEKLADAYIKSQNNTEAKNLLQDAICKYKNAGITENEILSLQTILNSIEHEKEDNLQKEDEDAISLDDTNSRSFWYKILSLFR